MLEYHHGVTQLSSTCQLDATLCEETITIRLCGEFDLACEQSFQETLGRLLDDAISSVVIDLRELKFMDSTGLAALIALHCDTRRDGRDLEILCGTHGPVRRILRDSGMDGVLPVVDSFGRVPATDSPV